MAFYNTFVVIDCNTRKSVLITSSARKANKIFNTGYRIEVWNNNNIVETIHFNDTKKEKYPMKPYIDSEKKYICEKQKKAEERNLYRRNKKWQTNKI